MYVRLFIYFNANYLFLSSPNYTQLAPYIVIVKQIDC